MRPLLVLAIALIGCHVGGGEWSATPIVGPDGSHDWIAITCRHRTDCLVLAGRECSHGWTIVEDNTSQGQQTHVFVNGYAGGASSKPVKEIDLLVRCKEPYDKPQVATPAPEQAKPAPVSAPAPSTSATGQLEANPF